MVMIVWFVPVKQKTNRFNGINLDGLEPKWPSALLSFLIFSTYFLIAIAAHTQLTTYNQLLQPIIRRLFGNDHIMDVAFAHAGGTDL